MASYTWVFLIVLIFVGAISYAFLLPSMNKVTEQTNKQIVSGEISAQTATSMKWNLNFLFWLPGIILLGLAIWVITRAIEISEAGGGGF